MVEGDSIHTTARAVSAIHGGLAVFEREFTASLQTARRALSNVVAQGQAVLAESERALQARSRDTAQASAVLARCNENCSGLADALNACKKAELAARARVERNQAALRQIEAASSNLTRSMSRSERFIGEDAKAAKRNLLEHGSDIQNYLAATHGELK
jgi:septation ring formation regulator EzrA